MAKVGANRAGVYVLDMQPGLQVNSVFELFFLPSHRN